MSNPNVILKTTMGDVELELFKDKAPVTVENFLSYVKKGHYKDAIFHRVIGNFMIQGGGMDKNMKERSTDKPIKNEATNGLSNDVGTIAMARTGVVDSATAQFFINVADNKFLNHRSTNPADFGYAVFGKVVSGMDVVNKIKIVKTTFKNGHDDVPVEPIEIKEAVIK